MSKIKKYMSSLSEIEKVDFCKKLMSAVVKSKRAKDKAVESEFNYKGDRRGVRGGKFTSLNARATSCAQIYQQSVNDLKQAIQEL